MLEREDCPPQTLVLPEDSYQALCLPGHTFALLQPWSCRERPCYLPFSSESVRLVFPYFLESTFRTHSIKKTNCGACCRVYLKQITSSSSNNKLEIGWVVGTRVEPLCEHTGCRLGRSFSTWPACSSPLLGGYLPITLP